MGVVDGDIGMQGLHICVLQPLYLELVLHVGSVYRSQTELRSRSGQGQFHIPNHNQKVGTSPTQLLPSQRNNAKASTPTTLPCGAFSPPQFKSLAPFPSCPSSAPAEKMLMAMSKANSASLSCSSFMALENSKMGLMNSTCSPGETEGRWGMWHKK